MSVLVGLLFISFTSFTLKMAPIPLFFFSDARVASTGPDVVWENLAWYWSSGTFSESRAYCLLNRPDEVDVDVDTDNDVPQLNYRPFSPDLVKQFVTLRDAIGGREVLRVLQER